MELTASRLLSVKISVQFPLEWFTLVANLNYHHDLSCEVDGFHNSLSP